MDDNTGFLARIILFLITGTACLVIIPFIGEIYDNAIEKGKDNYDQYEYSSSNIQKIDSAFVPKVYDYIIPNKFFIDEKITLVGTEFSIKDSDKQDIGYKISQDFFSFFTNVNIYKGSSLYLSAKEDGFSWGKQIDIYDANGRYIGKIKEEVFSSLFSSYNTYNIYNSNNEVIGYSLKTDIFATSFTIYDVKDQVVATVKRDMFSWTGDMWGIEIFNESVSKDILLFIPVYKTIADNNQTTK